MHSVTRVTPIDDIDGKSHKTAAKIILPIIQSQNHATIVIYSLGGGHTHTHTNTPTLAELFQETRHAPAAGRHAPTLKIHKCSNQATVTASTQL